jgi:glucose/arabinose dehydrogenase
MPIRRLVIPLALAGLAAGTAVPATAVPATAVPATAAAAPHAAAPRSLAAVTPRVASTVATGIKTPWGIAFLPDGSALVSERDPGVIVRVVPGRRVTVVGRVPGVVSNGSRGGEAGLLGLALSPRFARDHLIYAYVSTARDNRVVRMTYSGGRLGTPHAILTGIPHGLHHNGGRIAFGPDGWLYVSTGEAGNRALAQNRRSLGGKILRMSANGKAPRTNPFKGSVVYSYGHRNVEGLAWDSAGRLWATEFGDKAYDELNLILPGRNYGWPRTQGRTSISGYTSPKAQWRTSVAGPASVAVARSTAWIGGLTGKRLWAVPLSGARAGTPRAYFVGTYGRLRTVASAPDGSLWLTTSNTDGRGTPRRGDDRILRLRLT